MRSGLYMRLAADNIRRSARTYIPYLITCIVTAAMLYMIGSLSLNTGLDKMNGGYALREILRVGWIITRIFGFIFLFYTNSFLVKQRKKEFGLLNILGMQKRHIAGLLFTETLFTAAASLVCGLIFGILLDKLMYLVLTRIVDGNVILEFYISQKSLLSACVFMAVTFLIMFLSTLIQIKVAQPMQLLRSADAGEKEPKARWLMAVLGAACLGGGYYISITTKHPLQAITMFFIAVLLVIAGTYLLFMAGSIAILKIMKKNKRYYYKTKNFTSVSGMMYRMKQNAVGLANICILSTMVLVMISSTGCLMVGMNEIIAQRYPYSFIVESPDSELFEDVESFIGEENISVSESQKYSALEFAMLLEGNNLYIPEDRTYENLSDVYSVEFLDCENYNRLTGKSISLADGEILFHTDSKSLKSDVLRIMGTDHIVKEQLNEFPNIKEYEIAGHIGIVVNDISKIYELQKQAYGEYSSSINYKYYFNVDGGDKEKIYNDMIAYLRQKDVNFMLDSDFNARSDFLGLYGGLFFLGLFLGTLFIMETILIIYYKQISEGFDDKKRFEIMQKVGMSRAEVRQTIHSQIVKLFFLPLITAGMHTAFAFPLIYRLLQMMNMFMPGLFAVCLLVVFVLFAAVYAAVYLLTARAYYKIVSG